MAVDSSVVDVLIDQLFDDEEGCLAACRAQGGGVGWVPLIEGMVTVEEALSYARVLFELGQSGPAREIVLLVAGGMAAGCVVANDTANRPLALRTQYAQ